MGRFQGTDTSNGAEFAVARAMLLRTLRLSGVSDRVSAALMRVPRDQFVPTQYRRYAWSDESLPIGEGQTISQPSLVGRMIDYLQTKPEHRVLDIGTGSGYQAAILSLLVRNVVSVERVRQLRNEAEARLHTLGYANIEVHLAGHELGWPELAPYDGIIVGAASPEVPESLVNQLTVGGRLVIPVGDRNDQEIVVVERTRTGRQESRTDYVRFVPLIGEGAWPDRPSE